MEEDFTRIFDQIKRSEYEIRWQQDAGAYMAPNRAHNLRFTFHDDGVTVTPRKTTETPSWLASVSLVSYGRAGFPAHNIGDSSWSISENTAEVQSVGLTIGYRNDKEGLRQDFLIQEKPSGKGMLRLDFLTEHRGVTMNVDATENIVFFANANDEKVMRYSDITVLDANQQNLNAHIVQLDNDHFAIMVEDEEAQYPILVDPTFGGDGSEYGSGGDLFGYSIAYIMYVQNEALRPGHPPGGANNIGGLLVGVPYYDSGSHTDAGQVCFYNTDGGGLPATATWTYTGTEANELLGWSVDDGGANVTFDAGGSTYHNILVGAPGYSGLSGLSGGAAFAFYPTNTGNTYGSSPSWMVTGADGSSGNFGWSVAGNVDFNYDGFGDVIVGAPNADISDVRTGPPTGEPALSTSGQGEVSIFYGTGSGYSTTASWNETGGSGSDFGFSVNWGFVQGLASEGMYPALLVGAPGTNSSHGAVYEYLNSSGTPDTTPDLVIKGGSSGDEFGYALGSRQDQNYDGYQDLLVGAPNATYSSRAGAGKVYLYRGGSSGLSSTAVWTLGGDSTNANLGTSVALGDMTTNDYADVIIGEPNMSSTNVDGTKFIENGWVQFYLTDTTSPNLPVYSLTLEAIGSYYNLGTSVGYCSPLVNNNVDIIVSAPGATAVSALRYVP